MADIDIVPKRRSMTWLWVLLAIVVVAIVMWALMGRNDTARSGSVLHGGAPVALATHLNDGARA